MENKKLKTFSMILIISISAILLLAMGSVTSLQDYSKYGINFSDNWNMKSDENEIETYNLGDKIDKKAGFACRI